MHVVFAAYSNYILPKCNKRKKAAESILKGIAGGVGAIGASYALGVNIDKTIKVEKSVEKYVLHVQFKSFRKLLLLCFSLQLLIITKNFIPTI